MFDERVRTIVEGSGSEDYRLFITADKTTFRIAERSLGKGTLGVYRPNYREELAVGKVYKGTRKQDKPFHWLNLTAYILSGGNVSVAVGHEADDEIATEHTKSPETTIICTRDKDLRQVPGWHYGWECGRQAEVGPLQYDDLGTIELIRTKSSNKIVGGGWAFFCAQLLTGDVVDNIGGAKGIGPVRGYEILSNCTTEQEYFSAVVNSYKDNYGERWLQVLSEQCNLLWIARERLPDGTMKRFNLEEWIDEEI